MVGKYVLFWKNFTLAPCWWIKIDFCCRYKYTVQFSYWHLEWWYDGNIHEYETRTEGAHNQTNAHIRLHICGEINHSTITVVYTDRLRSMRDLNYCYRYSIVSLFIAHYGSVNATQAVTCDTVRWDEKCRESTWSSPVIRSKADWNDRSYINFECKKTLKYRNHWLAFSTHWGISYSI